MQRYQYLSILKVGITEKECVIRWKQHISLLEKNKHTNYNLQLDWNMYGKNNFVFEEMSKGGK